MTKRTPPPILGAALPLPESRPLAMISNHVSIHIFGCGHYAIYPYRVCGCHHLQVLRYVLRKWKARDVLLRCGRTLRDPTRTHNHVTGLWFYHHCWCCIACMHECNHCVCKHPYQRMSLVTVVYPAAPDLSTRISRISCIWRTNHAGIAHYTLYRYQFRHGIYIDVYRQHYTHLVPIMGTLLPIIGITTQIWSGTRKCSCVCNCANRWKIVQYCAICIGIRHCGEICVSNLYGGWFVYILVWTHTPCP